MDIVKRLRLNGNSEPTAVLLSDGGIEYPVFMTSLLNNVVLDELLNSGWKLCQLPCDLRKDNVRLSNLPIEDFNPTQDEEQEMYDSIGEQLTNEELRARLSDSVEYLEMPEGEYTINTREEFLKYLSDADKYKLDTDFLPINYFVNPAALFSFEEYTSGKYAEYVNIMCRRRNFSYIKMNMFIEWCLKKGLNPNFQPLDLVDFYYQWGIDGLNLPLVSKKREMRYRLLGVGNATLEQMANQYVCINEIGLVDKYGTILVPDKSKGVRWEPKVTNQEAFTKLYSKLDDNDTAVVELKAKSSEEVTILDGREGQVIYNVNTLMVGGLMLPNIYVYANDNSGKPINPTMWNPNKYEELKTICNLRALARVVIEKLKVKSNVSSFKALTLLGCSPKSALEYYVENAKLDRDESTGMDGLDIDNTMPVISVYDVDKLIDGTGGLPEEKEEILRNFLDGISNIDNTYTGQSSEDEHSDEDIYNELYAVHYVLGVSLDEIYEKVNSDWEDSKKITFSGNNYKYTLNMHEIRDKIKGYLCDLEDYRDAAIEDALEYLYVTKIAREIGSVEASRHVGIEALVLRRSAKATAILSNLKDIYTKKVEENIPNIQMRTGYLKLGELFAVSKFFEAALKGQISFPSQVSSDVIKLSIPEQQAYASMLTTGIESTQLLADTNIQGNGKFRRFCVNAWITPQYVIPKGKYSIKESSFLALWRDFSANPNIQEQLIAKGIIEPNHVPWDNIYYNYCLCTSDIMSNEPLSYYDEQANKYRLSVAETEEFVAVPHPSEYLNPGLYGYEEDNDKVATGTVKLREGAPMFKIGEAFMRTAADYEFITGTVATEDVFDIGIKSFKGFDAEDFYLQPDAIKNTFMLKQKPITVYGAKKFYTKDTGLADYTEIAHLNKDEYPVFNVRGSKYVFRDIKGKYWEVVI